jgi:hypothetical protein
MSMTSQLWWDADGRTLLRKTIGVRWLFLLPRGEGQDEGEPKHACSMQPSMKTKIGNDKEAKNSGILPYKYRLELFSAISNNW